MQKPITHPGVAPRDPRGTILAILEDLHKMIIYGKYPGYRPFGYGEEDFQRIFYIFLCKTGPRPGVAPHDPRDIILAIFGRPT